MHGDLRTTSLEQLCRALDQRQATGRLMIEGPADQINVWFRQGRVARATADGHELRLGDRLVHGGLISAQELERALAAQRESGRPLGEALVDEGLVNRLVVRVFMQEQVLDALFAAVRWTTGTYTFTDEDVAGAAVPTDLTVPQLLFALETRHRVWDEITRTIPDLDAVPEFVPGSDPTDAPLEPGEAAILQRIDGHHSLRQISDELGFGEYEVAGVVHGLTVLGMVRLRTGDGNGQAPTAATPHVVGSQDTGTAVAATSAVAEATAFLRGDEPAPAEDSEPEPAVTFQVADSPSEPAGRATDVPSAPAVVPPQPEPASSADDDMDPEPWAFVIGGEDEGPLEEEPPRPRQRVDRPITSPVADSTTGTPLPEPTPEPAAAPAPEPAPEAEPEPVRGRNRTGDMSDLLRELRQLSDE